MWISFWFTVPLALLDAAYCGWYLGRRAAYLVEYWYLTVFYVLPWALFGPMALLHPGRAPGGVRDPDVSIDLDIRRPPHEVRAWWLEMEEDYVAKDPREQPFRIRTLRRTESEWEIMTYWRVFGRVTKVPETFHLKPDGDWDVDITLPFGLRQRDSFVLHPTKDGTRVEIRVWVEAPTLGARLARPFYLWFYAKPSYRRTWKAARDLCERDAPVIPVP